MENDQAIRTGSSKRRVPGLTPTPEPQTKRFDKRAYDQVLRNAQVTQDDLQLLRELARENAHIRTRTGAAGPAPARTFL